MSYQSLPEVNENNYKGEESKDFITDIINRKEFGRLIQDNISSSDLDPNDALPFISKHLRLQSQQLFCKGFINPNTQFKRLWLKHGTGIGKCFAAGTKIRMYDGSVRAVETLAPGDILMGDDWKPRNIDSICKGQEKMYDCILVGGGQFTCNESHILCLADGAQKFTLTVREYLALLPEVRAKLRMYKRAIASDSTNAQVRKLLYIINNFPVDWEINVDSPEIIKISSSCKVHIKTIAYLCWGSGIKVYKYVLPAAQEGKPGEIQFDSNINRAEYQYYDFEIRANPTLVDYYGFTIDGNNQFLLADFTVAHNTLASVVIAEQFVNVYKKMYQAYLLDLGFGKGGQMHGRRAILESDRNTPTVFVFGFTGTKIAFLNELMKWPEFGYVTASEKERLAELHSKSQEAYLEYFGMLKKRITSKINGGFYKFFGYDEFVNKLFVSESVNLAELEQKALRSGAGTIEQYITEAIDSGQITINRAILAQMNNCIIICDEAHNLYNSVMKNSRGVAIQYLLDTNPSIRAVFVSATPINTPGEVVDMVNLISPKDKKITKADIFEHVTDYKKLRPGALDLLAARFFGRISFVQDSNPKYYPKLQIDGEPFKLSPPIEGYDVIPYLKFIICEISPAHAMAYQQLCKDQPEAQPPVIPSDGQSLYDLVFPNPENPDGMGIYRRDIVRAKLLGPNSPEFTSYANIQMGVGAKQYLITGKFLTRPEISKYSAKYSKMLDKLEEVFESGQSTGRGEKIMIYHNRVKQNGVLLIQEILKANGLIDEGSEPVENTRCATCGRIAREHKKKSGDEHGFSPARFIVLHNGIDKNTIGLLVNRFNMPENNFGDNIKILVGSKVMKESFDLKAVQHLWVMSLPSDIPILLQIFGRARRNKSHVMLPPENRVVHICLFISKSPPSLPAFPEQYKYIDKLLNYSVVQLFENKMNSVAVDANLYRGRVMPAELKAELTDESGRPKNVLGNIYFDPLFEPKIPEKLSTSTFDAYDYNIEEVEILITNIKLLFLQRPAWTYDELWAAIKRSKMTDINAQTFSEGNFAIALSFLVEAKKNTRISHEESDDFNTLIERLFSPKEKYIYQPGQPEGQNRFKITQVGAYYILFPALSGQTTFGDKVVADVDVYMQNKEEYPKQFITLEDVVTEPFDYQENLNKFAKDMDKNELILLITDAPKMFQRALVEDIISKGLEKHIDKAKAKKITSFYEQFDLFIYLKMLMPEIKEKYKGMAEGGPIGYIDGRNIYLYSKSGWATYADNALISMPKYIENKDVVGYMEEGADFVPVFKLRRSLTSYDLKKGGPIDIRQIDRGIACHNKGKDQILEIAQIIGVSAKLIKTCTQSKIKALCNVVRGKIIENEIEERKKGSNKKWFYFWWEELPSIKTTFR